MKGPASTWRVSVEEGVSTNMMEGPAVSSSATVVRGVGFEVNFGSDWWRIAGGLAGALIREDEDDGAASSLCFAFSTAVSEAEALGCGLSGVMLFVVDLLSL